MTDISSSAVICTYTGQRWDELFKSVASVRGHTDSCNEIMVVVDQNPTLLARPHRDLVDVKVIDSDQAKGLSGARNCAVANSSGAIIVFLDDDARADENWLQCLLDPYKNLNVLGVGDYAKPDWESYQPSCWPHKFSGVVGCSFIGQLSERAEIRNLVGCNMPIRRTVFDAVGAFDPALSRAATGAAGGEDTELCIRTRRGFPQGIRCAVAKECGEIQESR